MPFTSAQLEAIQSRSPELLVSAAAGSGKTAVLVERILRMIAVDGLSIDRMLIVTFTRAAAGEMRERLETRLAEAAQERPELQKQADLVSSAQISTIHAFCQKLVRQHFQHCRIDPQFGLCDERTRQAFYHESMEETLTALYDDATRDEELAALAAKFSEQEILDMISALYRFVMSRPDPLEWLSAHASHDWNARTLDAEPLSAAFCQEAGLMIDAMQSLWRGSEADARLADFPQKYLSVLRLDGIELQTLADACQKGLNPLAEALGALRFTRLPPVKPDTDAQAALIERFKERRERYKELAGEIGGLLGEGLDAAVSDMRAMDGASRGLCKAVLRFHDTFTGKKRDQAVIDFTDLEHMALSVLREPSLRGEVQNRFDAVFVDEYQDVSELQEALLAGLRREGGAPQYAFYVGDVKQSIYRFRLAEPGLFLSKLSAFSADAAAPRRKIVLNRNFRSKTAVLDAVNRVFSHVMDARVTEIDYDADARLYPGLPSRGDPPAELHLVDDAALSSQEQVLAEAELIARDILRTVGLPTVDGEGNPGPPLRYRDIAILLPVGKGVSAQVEQVLTRHGIPVYAGGGEDTAQADEVLQVAQVLSVLDNLMNDLALLSVLRGPLFGFTEPELSRVRLRRPEREASFLCALLDQCAEDSPLGRRCRDAVDTLERERFYLRSMPLGDYLWDFLGRSGLYAHYGAQPGGLLRQANLRVLCQRAGEYENTHLDGLRGFLDALAVEGADAEQGPAVVNPWEDVVRVMTIHKSKGLEFPTVYVMNLGRPLFGRPATRALSVRGDLGYGLCYVNERARTKRPTLLQGAIALRERNAARAERARVLYVALTRPKSRLVMVGSGAYDEGILHHPPADRHSVRTAASMLDWLVQCVDERDEAETREGFSTISTRKTDIEAPLSTFSTCFPQKQGAWRVVFHIGITPEMLKGARSAPSARPVLYELPNVDAAPSRIGRTPQEGRAPAPTDVDAAPSRQGPSPAFGRYGAADVASAEGPSPAFGRCGVADVASAEGPSPAFGRCGAADVASAEGPSPAFGRYGAHDPLSPNLDLPHYPLKVGVTALCRAMEEQCPVEAEEESAETKRFPLSLARPRPLSSVPARPAFLEPPKEEAALQTGVETHRLLGLMRLDGAREAADPLSFVRGEVERLQSAGVITAAQAAYVDARMAARFLSSDLGRRMLASPRVQREWAFNLRVTEPFSTVVQGVIDLCFLENGAWVLVDFKTDRVSSAAQLWPRYRRQIGFYRQALECGTPYPVSQAILYALRLGEGAQETKL